MNSPWPLDVKSMSWTERSKEEVDFIVEALGLKGSERVLDLACGFGRHSLELARRGFRVVGVDFTEAYIDDALESARSEGLDVDFICQNVLDCLFEDEFDVVLNMADGAIGYFETEAGNLRVFDVVARALRIGGGHVMGVCSAAHARRHFPKRHWEAGRHSLSLADFRWDEASSRMLYRGRVFKFGERLDLFTDEFPSEPEQLGIRLYTLEELEAALRARGLRVDAAYGAYDVSIPASEDRLMQVLRSTKVAELRRNPA